MKLLIKIIFLYILYSCDNYCGCCCNCCQNCFWGDKGNEDNDLNKTQQHNGNGDNNKENETQPNVNEGNNEVNDEDKNIEKEVDKIINGQYKDINDEELKQVMREILLIEKYGSCIVCKDTTEDTSGIDKNYDFEQNQYTYSYSVKDRNKLDIELVINNKFNYRHNHICMSMLAKRRDTNKILGNLYRQGVVGYILKPESDSYLIGDGFINYQRKDLGSSVYNVKCSDDEELNNFEYANIVVKSIEDLIKKAKQEKLTHIFYCDNLFNNTFINEKIKTSERLCLNFKINCSVHSEQRFCGFYFTNLSLLLAKDDEKCYRLKDDITQDDNSPFVDVNLEDTLSTEIRLLEDVNCGKKYFDNMYFYKPTENFFKNVCKTGCLNNSEVKIYKLETQKEETEFIQYNEIPIVPIKKVNNNNSDEIKYTLECIDLFVDMRTQNKKDYDDRMVKHYNTALELLKNKNKKYVIVLTDEYFVIDTVENLSEYFKYKEEVYTLLGAIIKTFSDLDYAKNYKINYDIDFNKRYKTEN